MDSVACFRADLAHVLPEGLRATEPLALAVSGGPDSMALLWLAAHALPGHVIAATVDHGLRPDSAAEAELVAAICTTIGVPHAALKPDQPIAGGNLHAAARVARYGLLARWAISRGARALATAHQLDDQAETFLMRAVRGAGPSGLAGVRTRREIDGLTVIRPLLRWRRAELADIVRAAGLTFVTDPYNTDDRFERARVRKLLADQPWLDPVGLARAATNAGEADRALAAMQDWLWRTRRADAADGEVALDMTDLPRELRRRLARQALTALRPAFDIAANIEPLLDALEAGKAATQADILVTTKNAVWRFAAAPPRRDMEGTDRC